ncbi:hypothetical protein C8J57DRAFT_1279209 [Mycena rebaudengoi]|nr:hypothetical protein C8J57DRAFT_1279209 [Mycena rebaudengoi]
MEEATSDGLTVLTQRLNASPRSRIFQISPGSTLLLGDVMLSKTELDFEVTLEGLQPGVWASCTEGEQAVLMQWIQAGSVDYDNLAPLLQDPQFDDTLWEAAGEFSVDASVAGAIVSEVLEDTGPLIGHENGSADSEVVLESFMDMVLMNEVEHVGSLAVPGGVVAAGDDGTYSVFIRRNAENLICAVKFNPGGGADADDE